MTPNSSPSRATVQPTSAARRSSTSETADLLLGEDAERTGLEDTRLLGRDLLDRRAEEADMVDRDRRDHRDLGVDHVGRVPRPAHADLHDRHVHRGVGERRVGHRGEDLEERQPHAELVVDEWQVGRHVVVRRDEPLLVDGLAVEGDALRHGVQVRTGEPAGSQAELLQERVDHPGRRRLAVRAGDVDHRDRVLR
jgi:hypothetical protein